MILCEKQYALLISVSDSKLGCNEFFALFVMEKHKKIAQVFGHVVFFFL